MSGFKKIDLSSNKELPVSSGKKRMSFKYIKVAIAILLVVIIFFSAVLITLFFTGKELYFSAQKTVTIGLETYDAVKNQNIEKATEKLAELKNSLSEMDNKLKSLSWFGMIPIIGVYEKDAEHMLKASIAGVSAANIAVDTLVPYADLLGLKGKSTFVAGSADERIQTAVATLDKVTPRLEEISQQLIIVGKELDQVDADRYPQKIGSIFIRNKIKLAKDLFSENAQLFAGAQPLLKKIPELLGTKDPKSYLVIFQNDAELRATGGFITAYALFKVDKGKMQVVKADDIYKLDQAKKKKYPAPLAILKYHKNVNNLELRDSNLSPDFNVSIKDFEKMLTESIPDFPKFDGVITVDTHVLVESIKILGEFNVYGRIFNAEIDSRCDCPKAIYELEDYSTRPVAYVREDRKDIIGVLLYQIMQRALGVSPSKYWGNLFQMFLEEAKQKHVLFYFHDEEAQKGIEALNYGGRIVQYNNDYLHINDVNFAGAKSNMFIKQSVKQEINADNNGKITKTLVINYKNPAPPSNCNLEAGQLCLNGILRNWIRIYVPKGSILVSFNGSEKETVTYEDLDKTVFEGFFTVKPQGSTQLQISYRLPDNIKLNFPYKLMIQKQPGTDAPQYSLYLNGKEKENFELKYDKEILFKN